MPMYSYDLCSILIKQVSKLPSATYPYVPASEVQLDESWLRILVVPKSETWALYYESSKTFLLDMSLWTIGGEQPWCM